MDLLKMLSDQLGGQLVTQASKFLGESEGNVGSALDGIFPALLGKVADIAGDKSGAEKIFDMVKGTDDGILDDIGGLFGGGPDAVNKVLGSGSGIVNAVFGGGLGSIIEKVAGLSGVKKSTSSSLVKMAAPFLFGMVKRAVMKKGLDAVGLGKLLGEQRSFVDKLLPAGLGSVLGLGKNLVSGVTNTGKAAVSGTMDAGKNLVGGVGNVAGKAVGGVSSVAGTAAATTAKAGGGILKWLIPVLLGLLALGFFGFKTGCGAVDNAADMTKGAMDKTVNVAKDAGGAMTDAAKDAGGAMKDAAKGAGSMISGAFGKIDEAAKATLDKVKFDAGSAGDQMVKFINGGFKGKSTFQIKNGNFASGSDVLTAETKKELDNLTSVLNAYPGVKLSVDGYTDSTGDAGKNKTLSENRAKSVKAYLIQKGVKGNRIKAQGFGAANPIASNDTKEGQAQNRRIELKVMK